MSQKNYSEVMNIIKSEFSTISNDTFTKDYSAILEKTVTQFSVLAGNNYSFTPAIPKIIQGRKYEIYFAYLITQDRKILRPHFKVAADYTTGEIVEFQNSIYSDFVDSEKYPREKKFNAKVPVAKTAREQMILLKNLQSKYEKVRVFAFKEELSSEEKNFLKDYVKAIEETIPNELINFCIETEPFFFDWIKSKTV